MKATLDIIIVNWNSGSQLFDCLQSIISTVREGFELSRVVVVDNASSDASANNLETFDLPLLVIHNTENRGFAAACNQGAAVSQGDYLLFLNPDTRLFKDSLVKPIQFMVQPENEKVGICGIQLLDSQGNVARSCARFPTPSQIFSKMLGLDYLFPAFFPSYFMDEWKHDENREVDHVMGAFFLVRRSLFEILGGFDERFFVYIEDLDFSFRMSLAGWHSFYLADAQAYHKGGGTSEQVKATRLFYALRSRIQYGYKHFNWLVAASLALGTLFIEPIARLGLAAVRLSGKEIREILEGYSKLWYEAPQLLRNEEQKQF